MTRCQTSDSQSPTKPQFSSSDGVGNAQTQTIASDNPYLNDEALPFLPMEAPESSLAASILRSLATTPPSSCYLQTNGSIDAMDCLSTHSQDTIIPDESNALNLGDLKTDMIASKKIISTVFPPSVFGPLSGVEPAEGVMKEMPGLNVFEQRATHLQGNVATGSTNNDSNGVSNNPPSSIITQRSAEAYHPKRRSPLKQQITEFDYLRYQSTAAPSSSRSNYIGYIDENCPDYPSSYLPPRLLFPRTADASTWTNGGDNSDIASFASKGEEVAAKTDEDKQEVSMSDDGVYSYSASACRKRCSSPNENEGDVPSFVSVSLLASSPAIQSRPMPIQKKATSPNTCAPISPPLQEMNALSPVESSSNPFDSIPTAFVASPSNSIAMSDVQESTYSHQQVDKSGVQGLESTPALFFQPPKRQRSSSYLNDSIEISVASDTTTSLVYPSPPTHLTE